LLLVQPGWACVVLFLLFALWFSPSHLAAAWAQPTSVRVSLGWDGWIRFGTWNPVTVDVQVDRPVRGWLVVEVPQEFGTQRVRLRHRVDLPPAGGARWHLAVMLSDARRPVRASVVLEEGSPVASAEVAPQPERAAASVVAYLGADPPTPPQEVSSGGRRAVVRLTEELLPDRAAAYASLDLLVVGELDERRLSEAQRRALQTWVLHGGRVVVAGWLLPTAPLSGWLSVAQEVGAAGEAAGLRSVTDGPLRLLHPLPGSQLVVERSRTVAVWASRGLGRVYAWAVGAARVPPDSPLWYLALPAPLPHEGPPEVESRPRVPLAPAAAGLGLYVALWLVAVWLAGRSGLGWLAAGLVLAASAAGMPVLADRVRQSSAVLEAVWVEVAVEGTRRTYGWGRTQAPYRGSHTYTLPSVEAVAVSGGFTEVEVAWLADRVLVRADQAAGERLRLRWEALADVPAPQAEARNGAVVVQGAGGAEGLAFWGSRQAPLERSGASDQWVASRWQPVEPHHPALEAFRWAQPGAATIVEDRPVVAFPPGEGRQGWLVVVGSR